MGNNILSKEFVLQNGIDFENLHGKYCSDLILDKPEDKGGKPFTGLTYELYKNGQLQYYCYYKDGFEDGQYVEFYENGNVKSIKFMKYGQIRGREETWYENGNPKLVAECEFGIYLSKKEWDINGNLINEKTNILEDELEILNKSREYNKRLGRS